MSEADVPQPDRPGRTRVLLLGSGEPAHELVSALQRLGAEVITADPADTAEPADTDEPAATIRRLRPNVVVAGAEVVADELAVGDAELVPSARAARLSADPEAMLRLAAGELGLPTPPCWFVGSAEELRAVAEDAGYPMVVKPVRALGGGRSVLLRPEDVEPAFQRATAAGGTRALAETVVEVDAEVTVLAVCTGGPALQFCAPIGQRSIETGDGRLVTESWQPQPMSGAAADAARSIAARVVRACGGRGLFGVQLLIHGDEVYFAGATVHPGDTAWVTLRTQRLSGFELQARAILGLPVDTILITPGAARLLYAAPQTEPDPLDPVTVSPGALAVPESDAVVFGDPDSGPLRRLAVALASAGDTGTARRRAEQVADALGAIRP